MRIVGGRLRGLRLAGLGKGDPAAALRPTSDRVRESLFNILLTRYGIPGEDTQVLDLFAGTGALGLEALSRGADRAVFVDSGRAAQALITENIARAGVADRARLIARDATRLGPCPDTPATLVMLDPPYGTALGRRALAAALAGGWIGADAVVAWEDAAPQDAPKGFALEDRRRYGAAHITFLVAS